MFIAKYTLAAAAILTSGATAFAQEQVHCPKDGAGSPLVLHEEWIMDGWERREGDPEFDFVSRMGKYYDLENPQGTYWDNFAPGDTQLFDDASVYGANWEDLQNGARSVQHGITNGNDAIVSEDVTSTTLGFVGRLERLTGEVLAFDARSQLGWACVDGEWKIKHEMNYAWVVEPESIEPILGKRLTP